MLHTYHKTLPSDVLRAVTTCSRVPGGSYPQLGNLCMRLKDVFLKHEAVPVRHAAALRRLFVEGLAASLTFGALGWAQSTLIEDNCLPAWNLPLGIGGLPPSSPASSTSLPAPHSHLAVCVKQQVSTAVPEALLSYSMRAASQTCFQSNDGVPRFSLSAVPVCVVVAWMPRSVPALPRDRRAPARRPITHRPRHLCGPSEQGARPRSGRHSSTPCVPHCVSSASSHPLPCLIQPSSQRSLNPHSHRR